MVVRGEFYCENRPRFSKQYIDEIILRKAFIIIGLIGIAIGIYLYFLLFGSNTGTFSKKDFLYIPTGSNYDTVLQRLKKGNFIRNIRSFDKMAKRLNYPQVIKAGKYQIKPGMGNLTIVQLLKQGKQTPVKVVLNKLRTEDDIIRKICSNLEITPLELKALFRDSSFLQQYQIDSQQIQVIIVPDTYQFYWNTPPKKVIEKIARNYRKFWTDERKQKAAKFNLSIPEIVTLASIVEEETNKASDKPLIASTYLNRLKTGMPLQADPTLKFAVGDFTIKRLLHKHTQFPSTYNTYLNRGLPPGPICTPYEATIDSTLNAPVTDYLYFCASETFDGSSNFAATYAQHQENAKKYQRALNDRGIR